MSMADGADILALAIDAEILVAGIGHEGLIDATQHLVHRRDVFLEAVAKTLIRHVKQRQQLALRDERRHVRQQRQQGCGVLAA